jgi:hypothetical protein
MNKDANPLSRAPIYTKLITKLQACHVWNKNLKKKRKKERKGNLI